MIREHAFNTAWWRRPVGVVSDHALFALPPDVRDAALTPFDFVELRGREDALPSPRVLGRAGFVHVDTQMHFRIGLTRVPASPTLEQLEVRFADEVQCSVSVERLAPFKHERFRHVPGMTAAKLTERYATWATHLVTASPETCLAVYESDALQGWFLSRPAAGSLHLTLAALTNDARISGHHLYQRAAQAYGARGYRIGKAEFSVANTSVLNIYASLGARFVDVEHCWLWISEAAGMQERTTSEVVAVK